MTSSFRLQCQCVETSRFSKPELKQITIVLFFKLLKETIQNIKVEYRSYVLALAKYNIEITHVTGV